MENSTKEFTCPKTLSIRPKANTRSSAVLSTKLLFTGRRARSRPVIIWSKKPPLGLGVSFRRGMGPRSNRHVHGVGSFFPRSRNYSQLGKGNYVEICLFTSFCTPRWTDGLFH